MPTLIVHGATSFTASALLLYLRDHPDLPSLTIILAGRSLSRLETRRSSLGVNWECHALDLSDESAVRALVDRGDVVLNLAGPFKLHGAEALIRSCAETGKHYVDVSAERAWMGDTIIPKYDFLASQTGACIVPSCGFDSVPSDLIVYSALRALQSDYPSGSITHSASFFKLRGSVAGGTIATMYSEIDQKVKLRGGEWALIRSVSGPFTPLRLVYSLSHPAVLQPLLGSFFFMYPYNRALVRRSWWLSRLGDVAVQSSDHPLRVGAADEGPASGTRSGGLRKRTSQVFKGTREPRHGDSFVYEESLQLPSRLHAVLVSLAIFTFGAIFALSSWFRWIVRFFLPKPGEGASPKALAKGYTKVTNLSKTSVAGVAVLTTLKGEGDPGYVNTGHMMVESALSLALPPPPGTQLPPLAFRGGVLTPSTAMGEVLVERLRKSGKVVVESRVVDDSLEGRKTR